MNDRHCFSWHGRFVYHRWEQDECVRCGTLKKKVPKERADEVLKNRQREQVS